MTDKLTPEECAVLMRLAAVDGKAFVFVKDHGTADRLANRGLIERKQVRYANVPLFRLGSKAAPYLMRHGRG